MKNAGVAFFDPIVRFYQHEIKSYDLPERVWTVGDTIAAMRETIELFDGTTLSSWGGRGGATHEWEVVSGVRLRPGNERRLDAAPGAGVFYNGPEGNTPDLFTEYKHGDCRLHIEFVVPKDSNSGVYLMGRYEVQVLDSWGKPEMSFNTCGGIYARWVNEEHLEGEPPRLNASRPPGDWQSYDIVFRAPRFDASGEKTENARFVSVTWNGELVHENFSTSGPTRAAMFEDERPVGPLMLQGDHGPVAYRNVVMEPLELE